MYCSGCGTTLDEGARFCAVCGMKVEVEVSQNGSVISTKKKKKRTVIAVSIAVVCLILGILAISFVALGGGDKIRVARLCDLGDRYLSELEYEEAIAAYEAAIVIEPRAEKAYIGLADAYIGLGDYEAALEALDRGIEKTNSRKLKDYRDNIQKEWDDKERRICGTVFTVNTDVDSSNNIGIPRVCVYLTDQRGETTTYYTDESGYFDTGKLNAGTYSLYFSMDGYVDYQCEVDLNGGRYELNVYLKPDEGQTEADSAVDLNPDEEQIEEENNSVVLYPGRYLIDVPEGFTIDLFAETDVIVSTYTMEKGKGETEYLGYKEIYNPGESLSWRCGRAGYLTYLTIYSGTVQATGQIINHDDETDTGARWDSYYDIDELEWYSETDIEGVFGIEITAGQTITIDNQNIGGIISYEVQYYVKTSDDLIGYTTKTDYWWTIYMGGRYGSETVNTGEIYKGNSYSFLHSCNKVEYTVTQGSMVWYTEYTNKDLLTISFDGVTEPDIPPDAYVFDHLSYMFYNIETITTWEEAKAYCESLGGHLAIITTNEENDFLYQLMVEEGYTSAYFGLSDSYKEGNWVWIDGTVPSYTNWHSGEPNSENSNEDYAMFYWKYTDGTWNDGDFGNKTVSGGQAFICEWD